MEFQIARGQIALGVVIAHVSGDEGVGFRELPFRDKTAGLRERPVNFRTVTVFRKSRPERVLIERKNFLFRAAVDHGAEPSVSERKGGFPVRGLLVIAECPRCVHLIKDPLVD